MSAFLSARRFVVDAFEPWGRDHRATVLTFDTSADSGETDRVGLIGDRSLVVAN